MSGPNQMSDEPAQDPAAAARGIARLYGEMWRRFQPPRRSIEGSDVTPRMLGLLRHLEQAGPLTVGEQATHLGIGRAAASELIDRLEGKRLVASLAGSVLDPPFLQAVAAITPKQRQQVIDGLGALLRAAGPAVSKEKAS